MLTTTAHVLAGLIGANPGNAYNITGVAYGATLHSYKSVSFLV